MTTRRSFIKKTALGSVLAVLPSFKRILAAAPYAQHAIDTHLPLSGDWFFRTDPGNEGIVQEWMKARFVDAAKLPGAMQSQGYGNDITAETEWWDGKLKGVWKTSPVYEKYRQPGHIKNYEFLQPHKHYLGAAWYAKECVIPEGWKDKRILLFLERVHWQSTVYINGREAGTQQYLSTPHEYDLTGLLSPGSNNIVIRVDNSRVVDVGDMPSSISEQTQGTWNGIVGEIALRTTDKIWIADLQVHPDISSKKNTLSGTVGNLTGHNIRAAVSVQINDSRLPPLVKELWLEGSETQLQLTCFLEDDTRLWDEHHPHLYTLSVQVRASHLHHHYNDKQEVVFGMREFSRLKTQFTVNGKKVHLRGNVDNAIFPLYGYPEMTVAWWEKLMLIYKEWGMNNIRFHSWCPPKAAFIAADKTGIYLQPECGDWSNIQTPEQFEFYKKESAAILKHYGNHPSFVTLTLGNEKSVKKEYLEYFLDHWKTDKRRLFNGKTGGKPLLDGCDFYTGAATKNGVRSRYYLGWPPAPGPSYFYQFPPATTRDYTAGVSNDNRPFIAHEIGQRCAYPDVVNLPGKFTGSLAPTYLEIARDQLQELGMLDQVKDFVLASGKWQTEMYKEEIEANLRTPGIGGFHLLSLQDFPGQGTAPVGFMDFFYEAKPYVTPQAIRKFCNHTVILARMKKRTWFNDEKLEALIELYNFSGDTWQPSTCMWFIKTGSGRIVHQQQLTAGKFPEGAGQLLGEVNIDLQHFDTPAKYNLEVRMDNIVNDWDFWVYPSQVPSLETGELIIADQLTAETEQALNDGKTVLLLPQRDHLKGRQVQCFGTFYWTAFDFHGGETSACGLLTNPAHPVFKYFPTDFHGNWQWWELLTQASPMILDDFAVNHPWPKQYRPLIQMVPSWKVNRKLGVLAEAKVAKGRIMLCSMDISTSLQSRKVAQQFRYSLLRYLQSADFNPSTEIDMDMLREVFV